MAETNTCQYSSIVTGLQTLDTGISSSASDNTVRHNVINTFQTLNASSTVPVTKMIWVNQALSGGAKTIDLTALTGTNGATVDFTGLKVQVAKFKNPSGNAAMTVKFGGTNPYNLLGASWTLILLADQEITLYLADAAPDVAGGAKTIDLSGTGSEVLEVQLFAG